MEVCIANLLVESCRHKLGEAWVGMGLDNLRVLFYGAVQTYRRQIAVTP